MKKLAGSRPNFFMFIVCMILALFFLGAFIFTVVTVREAAEMETIYTEIN